MRRNSRRRCATRDKRKHRGPPKPVLTFANSRRRTATKGALKSWRSLLQMSRTDTRARSCATRACKRNTHAQTDGTVSQHFPAHEELPVLLPLAILSLVPPRTAAEEQRFTVRSRVGVVDEIVEGEKNKGEWLPPAAWFRSCRRTVGSSPESPTWRSWREDRVVSGAAAFCFSGAGVA